MLNDSGKITQQIKLQADIMQDILKERDRQDLKWGEQNHFPEKWSGILGEKFGELCQAINETVFDNCSDKGGYENMKTEAIHVAAVAVGFLECLERNNGKWKLVNNNKSNEPEKTIAKPKFSVNENVILALPGQEYKEGLGWVKRCVIATIIEINLHASTAYFYKVKLPMDYNHPIWVSEGALSSMIYIPNK